MTEAIVFTDALLDLAHEVITSPWIYLVLFALSALDAFFPVVPSESVVITAGVFAADGKPNLLLVILAAAAGAFTGDHISYFIGRFGGARLLRRLRANPRRRKGVERIERLLDRRGGQVLIIARYIPGGRTITTLTMGAVAYPRVSFSTFDAIAGASWAVYSAMIGYLGGRAFEDNTLLGLAVGLGFALLITALIEVVRITRRRLRKRSAARASAHSGDTPGDTAGDTPGDPQRPQGSGHGAGSGSSRGPGRSQHESDRV